ncbi:uncharacterized protein LOC135845080 [Planococcus citri]|uniref:uncharacterized protein LOC135845080 n=1 Tax=Planococcus citri TaxID=170843 RepID=UPI0031FA0950
MTEKASVTCFHCEANFTRKCNLVRHIKNVHLSQKVYKNVRRIICSLCQDSFMNFSLFHSHLVSKHELEIKQECLTFNSLNEFQAWKLKEEKQSISRFVKLTRHGNLRNGAIVAYYYCHRSFHFVKKAKTAKKKHRGSNKTGFACPARMKVIGTNEQVTVNYCSSHVGHTCEVGRLTLNKEERAALASKLAQGIPMSRILDDIRAEESSTVSRIHLTDKNDLHNIKKTFKIACPLRYDDDDATSVKIFTEKMKSDEKDNPIIFYKNEQTESDLFKKSDYILIIMSDFQKDMFIKHGHRCICIDSTHDLNQKRITLYTITVLDEQDHGIPVAFCFSNLSTFFLFTFFFGELKRCLGTTITTKIFLSNEDVALYSAWSAAMGVAEHHVLSLWHLHNTWDQHLSNVDDLNKRKTVKKALFALSKVPNTVNFRDEFYNLSKRLQEDPDTTKFYRYIHDNYTKNVESWAACFQPQVILQTNMHLERFYKTFKSNYLNNEKCDRLDNTIHELLRFLRDKKYDQLIKSSREKPTKKRKNIIRESYKKATNDVESVEIIDDRINQVETYEVPVQRYESCAVNIYPNNSVEFGSAEAHHGERFDCHSDENVSTFVQQNQLNDEKSELIAKCEIFCNLLRKSDLNKEQSNEIREGLDVMIAILHQSPSGINV